MSTTVVIGCTPEPAYTLPIVPACLLWRHVVGYEPFVFLVGRAPDSLAHALTKLEIPHWCVLRPIEGYSMVATAKHVRQHAACLSSLGLRDMGENDDWIMPSDADLLPLRRDFYRQHEDSDAKAVLYYSNGDGFKSKEETIEKWALGVRFPTLPMCHITMRVRDWKSTWHLDNDLRGNMRDTFQRYGVGDASKCPPGEEQDRWAWWVDSDQRVATYVLSKQPWFPNEVKFIERVAGKEGPPEDRLDRGQPKRGWTGPGSFELKAATKILDPNRPIPTWTDAHVHKDPEKPENWRSILAICDVLIPEHSAFLHEYGLGRAL